MGSRNGDVIAFGGGRARRLIDLRRLDDSRVVGWLEDDFHHFGLTVHHAAGAIADVRAVAARSPYDTCTGAALPLRALIGAPLFERCADVGAHIDMRLQCTHLFDLAGLLVAHAWSGRAHRRYEATVEDREPLPSDDPDIRRFGVGSAKLTMDGQEVMHWQLDGETILQPQEWAGQSLGQGFRQRTEEFGVQRAEHATILRRIIMVSNGRGHRRDSRPHPSARKRAAVCHTFQPDQRVKAIANPGSLRDWQWSNEGMLGRLDEVPDPLS